jgi:hypothetical protein
MTSANFRYTCFVPNCERVLVMQLLNIDGLPLSQDERRAIDMYRLANDRTLECRHCGKICYSREDICGDYGKCKGCGGDNPTNRPKCVPDINKLRLDPNFRRIPNPDLEQLSCPVHGIKLRKTREINGMSHAKHLGSIKTYLELTPKVVKKLAPEFSEEPK